MIVDAREAAPAARRILIRERIIDIGAWVALVWTGGYLVWRAGFTLDGADAPVARLLLGAEALGMVVFAARVRSARVAPVAPVEVCGVPIPATTAVIDARDIPGEQLRTTLRALRDVVGVEHVIVFDPMGSWQVGSVVERFGATVGDPELSFAGLAVSAATDWTLLLRGGDWPMPGLVSVCAPACSAPETGVVQVAVDELDPGIVSHDPDSYRTLDPYEQQVVRPSLAARGDVPWYGDGPVMVRRSALVQAQAFLDHADSRGAGIAIGGAGLKVTCVSSVLARRPAPQDLRELLVRRHTRGRRGLSVIRPGLLAGLPRGSRTAHLLALLPTLAAIQRLLLVAAAVLVLGFAQVPLETSAVALTFIAVPGYLLRWQCQQLLGRGRLAPFSLLRDELRSLGVDLLPFGRLRVDSWRAGLGPVIALVAVLDLLVVVAALSAWRGWADRLPADVAALSVVIVVGFLGVAIEVLLDERARRQRRKEQRVRLGLVSCRLEEHDGRLVDISIGGVGVALPCRLKESPETGTVTTVAFRLPVGDGSWRSVSALVQVVHRSPDPEGGTRLGLAFDDPTDAPLDPVMEFLTTDLESSLTGGTSRLARWQTTDVTRSG